MQCTSYVPVYNSRDLNVGSSGISCHLFNGNDNYGEGNGYAIPLQPFNKEHDSSHDKDVLRQIIQNHETTFRHQVRELHRLYQKQRELMDEMRAKNVFLHHHIHSNVSHATSCVTGWHLGDSLQSMPAGLVYSNDAEFPFPAFKSNGNGNEIINLNLAAGVCHDDKRIQFSTRNVPQSCKLPEDVQEIRFATHNPRMSRECPANLVNGKVKLFINLNRPIEAVPQSVLPENSGFHYSNGNSDGSDSPMVIDLNFMPVGCFPETEMNPEHVSTVKETLEDHLHAKILEKPDIDLNTEVVVPNEPSSPTAQIKYASDGSVQGPESPENEETCPSRGKSVSEDQAQFKGIPISSECENGEQVMVLGNTAAENLVLISSCGAHSRLSWFAEIASAAGGDLESEIIKLENDESCINGGGFFSVSENAKESRKGHAGGKRDKNSHSKISLPEFKNFRQIRGFLETASSRRRVVNKANAKSRRCPTNNKGKRSVTSMLKQPAIPIERGVLRTWGKIKKREGGPRRRASKFVTIS